MAEPEGRRGSHQRQDKVERPVSHLMLHKEQRGKSYIYEIDY
jgi:hypothetical protein